MRILLMKSGALLLCEQRNSIRKLIQGNLVLYSFVKALQFSVTEEAFIKDLSSYCKLPKLERGN